MSYDSSATQDFFDARSGANKRKTEIVVAFYKGWATIMEREAQELLYVDLYAGRGYYDRCEVDPSLPGPINATPLDILKATIENVRFRAALIALLSDGDAGNVAQLDAAIKAMPGYNLLRHKPEVSVGSVDRRFAALIAGNKLKQRRPAFFFFDPFGYKGLTRDLIAKSLEDWGCDVAFFVNYNRLNMALGHQLFDEHLLAIFGPDRLQQLRRELKTLTEPGDREDCVMQHLEQSLKEIGGQFFISYRFRMMDGRTSHHLAFTSKAYRGYAVMKDKMARFSEKSEIDAIPLFEYVEPSPKPQVGLFSIHTMVPPKRFPWSISALVGELSRRYAKTEAMTFKELFERDNVGTPYLERHYREALWKLMERGGVITMLKPDGSAPKRGTCPSETVITFL